MCRPADSRGIERAGGSPLSSRHSPTRIPAAIAQSQQQLAIMPVESLDIASQFSYQLLYHGHPFASRGLGTAASLAHITPDDVRAAYRNYLLPNATVLAIVGRCDVDEVRGQAQGLFGLWAEHPRCPRPEVAPPRSPAHSRPCAKRRSKAPV